MGDELIELLAKVPGIFLDLAAFHHLGPEELLAMLALEFCRRPPRRILIVDGRTSAEGVSFPSPSYKKRRRGRASEE